MRLLSKRVALSMLTTAMLATGAPVAAAETSTDLEGKITAAGMIPEMLPRGTRKHTFEQLKNKLDLQP